MARQNSRFVKNIWFCGILVCILIIAGIAVKIFLVNPKQAALEDRISGKEPVNPVMSGYVAMNNGVSEEMLTASYWTKLRQLSGGDTSVPLMNGPDMAWINDRNRKMIIAGNYMMALEDIASIFNGGTAKAYIEATYDADDTLLNLENLPWGIDTKFGFSVVSGCMKRYPSFSAVYEDDNLYYDDSLQSDLPALMPVAIIHESEDGEWYYAFTYGYGGWVPKKNIALCATREEWIDRMNPEAFLVVTGRELRISTDPYHEELSGLLLPMGTKIPVVKPADAGISFHNRSAYGNYIAKLPVRNDDGSIGDKYVLIPVSEDVSEGFLEFTEDNIANLLMKHIGNIYGWAGDNNAVDCSGLVHEVYSCFGINLPRGAAVQSEAKELASWKVSNSGVSKKLSILRDAPIGTLLYFPGHIMMYLGMVDDIPYCISAVGSVGLQGEAGLEISQVNTVVITDMTDVLRADGRSWLESLERITEFRVEE